MRRMPKPSDPFKSWIQEVVEAQREREAESVAHEKSKWVEFDAAPDIEAALKLPAHGTKPGEKVQGIRL